MSGKLKITGNILAAQKLQQLWSEEAPRGSVSIDQQPELPITSSSGSSDDKTLLEVSHFSVISLNSEFD